MALENYEQAPYLVLATRNGLVKKTRLEEYDTNRTAGVIAVNLREGDELVSAGLASEHDDLMLVSKRGMSVRFTASDEALRPMGRATSGVTGMKFRAGDELLGMSVVRDDESSFVFTVTDSGYAKRSPVSDYRVQGRGGLGIKVANLPEDRGELVGFKVVQEDDEILVVMQSGKVVRTAVSQVSPTGRDTMGVIFAKPDKKDHILAVAKNANHDLEAAGEEAGDDAEAESSDVDVEGTEAGTVAEVQTEGQGESADSEPTDGGDE